MRNLPESPGPVGPSREASDTRFHQRALEFLEGSHPRENYHGEDGDKATAKDP